MPLIILLAERNRDTHRNQEQLIGWFINADKGWKQGQVISYIGLDKEDFISYTWM